jgi:hypothetical protein
MIYDGAFLNSNDMLSIGLLEKFSLAFGAMCFKFEQHSVSLYRNRITEFQK